MYIEAFRLERLQPEWEHRADYNLSGSGIDPVLLSYMLAEQDIDALLSLKLGYP